MRCWRSIESYHLLEDPLIEQLMVHEENKLLVYRRGPLVFAFNFHPHAVVSRSAHPRARSGGLPSGARQ